MHCKAQGLLLAVTCLLLVNPRTALGQEKSAPESLIKGVYLYNFAKFVDWPPQAFVRADSPLQLCILGPDPFEPEFEERLKGKTVHERKVVVRHLESSKDGRTCHILFISGRNDQSLREAIDTLRGKSILLVGDAPDFTRIGGMIQFITVGGTVRFEINLQSAERSGLKISSKLLRIASKGGEE